MEEIKWGFIGCGKVVETEKIKYIIEQVKDKQISLVKAMIKKDKEGE